MRITTMTLAAVLLATPVLAQDATETTADQTAMAAPTGDAAAGEKVFNKCKACHSIEGPDDVIVRGGKVGPNLYGVVGRQAGTVEGFSYSDIMVAAGEAGLNWNEDDFKVYVKDATAFLRDYTGDNKGRGKMTFKLPKDEDAVNVWAYLYSVGPEPSAEAPATN